MHSDIPRELAGKISEMAHSCSRLFEKHPQELATITAFVEEEMKGQHLPEDTDNRDEFVAASFQHIYPKVLGSDSCRQAVEQMMGGSDPFTHHDENPNYTIGRDLAETLYVTGSAVVGSIMMVTSGASGGSIEQREKGLTH
ncbi:hypothetical protein GXN76_13915 [Kroppenstedtia pulmonis]|uniref:Uncharacterized protein n=1 Tax=Kroppenstedtia pulmonis TaxID=1380685 RepID=A0A7D3Y1K5_9BACL|nr:hypothetical protein [Kroppenstedtia pulmonis]QKG85440.1 hypothetical protein GXN76_13915 [Kroppenstedtia pulmonis]